jgi:sec-independent protein translocase protein TatA
MMNDVAKGLKSFKQGMSEDDKPADKRDDPRQLPPQGRAPEQPIEVTPEPRPREDEQPRG